MFGAVMVCWLPDVQTYEQGVVTGLSIESKAAMVKLGAAIL